MSSTANFECLGANERVDFAPPILPGICGDTIAPLNQEEEKRTMAYAAALEQFDVADNRDARPLRQRIFANFARGGQLEDVFTGTEISEATTMFLRSYADQELQVAAPYDDYLTTISSGRLTLIDAITKNLQVTQSSRDEARAFLDRQTTSGGRSALRGLTHQTFLLKLTGAPSSWIAQTTDSRYSTVRGRCKSWVRAVSDEDRPVLDSIRSDSVKIFPGTIRSLYGDLETQLPVLNEYLDDIYHRMSPAAFDFLARTFVEIHYTSTDVAVVLAELNGVAGRMPSYKGKSGAYYARQKTYREAFGSFASMWAVSAVPVPPSAAIQDPESKPGLGGMPRSFEHSAPIAEGLHRIVYKEPKLTYRSRSLEETSRAMILDSEIIACGMWAELRLALIDPDSPDHDHAVVYCKANGYNPNTMDLKARSKEELAEYATKGRAVLMQLVRENLGLAYDNALKLKGSLRSELSHEELTIEGCKGLVRAIRKWDPNKEIRLSTYAFSWIRNFIQRRIFEDWGVTPGQGSDILSLGKTLTDFVEKNGREPNDDELLIAQNWQANKMPSVDAFRRRREESKRYILSLQGLAGRSGDKRGRSGRGGVDLDRLKIIGDRSPLLPSFEEFDPETVAKLSIVLDNDLYSKVILYHFGVGYGISEIATELSDPENEIVTTVQDVEGLLATAYEVLRAHFSYEELSRLIGRSVND